METEFLTLKQLCATIVPLTEQTVRSHVKRGFLPAIRFPGSRRLLFAPESVRNALLRRQRMGGVV